TSNPGGHACFQTCTEPMPPMTLYQSQYSTWPPERLSTKPGPYTTCRNAAGATTEPSSNSIRQETTGNPWPSGSFSVIRNVPEGPSVKLAGAPRVAGFVCRYSAPSSTVTSTEPGSPVQVAASVATSAV